MKYHHVISASFIRRINRFTAEVFINKTVVTVHVKNTGRCLELLLPATTVYLEKASNPNRKTAYDLVAVEKPGLGVVNIDSQTPNQVVAEWLAEQDYSYIKPEYTYGQSRIDFYMEKGVLRPMMCTRAW